ncbi:condensation domain-containing protein [Streptomyces lavendofoliae]|uniref:condensation domain-containing protein n=1 Tax=Streptomyces lavendofoliae TaxID=67314 RepID=UPI003D8D2C9D
MTPPGDRAELLARLARLDPEQRKALTARMTKARSGPPLRRRPGPRDRFPLGMDQERLWILDQLDPGTTTYTLGFGLRIHGAFDFATFAEAADAVAVRHELLRSGIESENGLPYLRLHSDRRAEVTLTDLTGNLSSDDSDKKRRRAEFIEEQVRRPFDLRTDPVLRLAVARLGPDDHQVVETMPHSFTDQWSYIRLNAELVEQYRALKENRVPRVPELPVQFGDYAQWQREYFTGERRERHREFWRGYLDGVPGRLALPYDGDPDSSDHTGRQYQFVLDKDVADAFVARARASRTTLANAMVAAYAALLYETTGERDLIVGVPSVTRSEPATKDLVGFLLTNVPLRIMLPPDPTPHDVLAAANKASLAVSDHREVPFGEIVEAVAPGRSATAYPLLQTMLVQLSLDDDAYFEVPDAEVYANAVPEGISSMDLTTAWWQVDGVVYGRIEYRTALFRPGTIARMARRLLGLVEQFATAPDTPLRAPRPSLGPAPASLLAPAPSSGGRTAASAQDLARITEAWCEVLGAPEAKPGDVFFDVGGTSLLAVKLTHRLKAAGFDLVLRDVFSHPRLGELADALTTCGDDAPEQPPAATGPLGPEQEILFGLGLERVELFAHSHVLTAAVPLDAERLRAAIAAVVQAHPALATAFDRHEGSLRATRGSDWQWSLEDPAALPDLVIERQRDGFDAAAGVLFAAALIPGADGGADRVVLSASHLVIDGMSWGIVIADLARAYRGDLPVPESTGFLEYAAALRTFDPAPHAMFWRAQLAPVGPLSWSVDGPNTRSGEREFERTVALPQDHGTLEAEALTAVARALRPYAPDGQVAVSLIGLGREAQRQLPGWDALRAVGFYSCPYPLHVPLGSGSAADDLGLVTAALRRVPDGGKTFGLLHCAADAALREEFRARPLPRAVVNYVGALADPAATRSHGLFASSRQVAATGNPDNPRDVDVDVAVGVRGGELVLRWLYNPDAVAESAVRAAADSAVSDLTELIAQDGREAGVPGLTGVSEEYMDRLFADLSRRRQQRLEPHS